MGKVADLVNKLDPHRMTSAELHELAALLDSIMSGMGTMTPWAMPGSGQVREGPGIDIAGANRVGIGLDSILLADSTTDTSAREYVATSAGLIAALAAATSGDTIVLPSLDISGGPWTVPAGVTVEGMGINSVLTGNITNNGILINLKTVGNTTNNKHAYYCVFTTSSGNNILLGSDSAIFWCEVNGGAYGVNIPSGSSNATVYHSRVYNATTAGLYCDSTSSGAGFSRFEGAIGGDVRNAELMEHCHFVGTGTDGVTHPSGTAEFLSCSFILEGGSGYGLNLGVSATLTNCYWESINGLANISYGQGDRATRHGTYLVTAVSDFLDKERAIVAGSGLTGTDGGAGSTYTLDLGSLTANWNAGAYTIESRGFIADTTSDTDIGLRIQRASATGCAQITLENESEAEIWRIGTTAAGGTSLQFYDQTQDVLVLAQNGDITFNPGGNVIVEKASIIDVTATEALLVRKNADGGDVFTVNTTTARVGIGLTGTPDAKLEVMADGAAAALKISRTGSAVSGVFDLANARLNLTADNGIFTLANVTTNTTTKQGRFGVTHYTNTEEPFLLFLAESAATENSFFLGGGTAAGNAASYISFYTAANNTTTTGTERMRILATGDVGIGSATASGQLHIDQASSTGAQPVLFLDQGDVSEQIIKASYSGADVDMILFDLDVTGSPQVGWDESENQFTSNKGWDIVGLTHIASPSTREGLPASGVFSDTTDSTKAIYLGYDSSNDYGIIAATDLGTAWKDIVISPVAGDVSIGTTTRSAKLHVDQLSATGAKPVLFLDQGDVSEQIIKASYSGADVDMIIVELDVTGTPQWGWDESADVFTLNKGLDFTGGPASFNTLELTAAGPTDNLDVSGVNVIFVDTSNNNVTLGGTVGGVDGQVLHIVIHDATNDTTLEHAEGTGNQDFYLHVGADEVMTAELGGWTFINHGGGHWHDVSHAKHV